MQLPEDAPRNPPTPDGEPTHAMLHMLATDVGLELSRLTSDASAIAIARVELTRYFEQL